MKAYDMPLQLKVRDPMEYVSADTSRREPHVLLLNKYKVNCITFLMLKYEWGHVFSNHNF